MPCKRTYHSENSVILVIHFNTRYTTSLINYRRYRLVSLIYFMRLLIFLSTFREIPGKIISTFMIRTRTKLDCSIEE